MIHNPPARIGKYEIQGILGQGGMGVVYRGYDRAIARGVAIKAIAKAILVPDEVSQVLARFRHEAQAVGRLVHPRIVQIYDYGEDDQLAYIVMELINGTTLMHHLARGDSYSMAESAEIIRQVLDGIGHAHAEGVVHRDIKPSNILINNDGRIKISDFGIARTEATGVTQAGEVVGTLHYMSPEQFAGVEIGTTADLYSIGVIAYELLAGKKPFNGNVVTLMRLVLSQIPEPPSRVNLELSPRLDAVLLKALAKSAEDRFQSAREFSDALKDAVEAARIDKSGAPVTLPGTGAALRAAVSAALPAAASTEASAATSDGSVNPPATSPDLMALTSNMAALMSAVRLLTPVAGALPATAAGAITAPGSAVDGVNRAAVTSSRNTDGNNSASITDGSSASAIKLDDSVKKARVLFIDDEERILTALKSQFRDRFHVFTTTDSTKALDFIGKFQTHVIVSDQRMPAMVGVELLRRSRAIAPNSVRILLTGYSDLAAIVGSINDGEVYRFISKPWDTAELQRVIAEATTIGLELADAKVNAAALPARIEAGVMVIDPGDAMLRVVRELLGSQCPVWHAPDLDSALQTMKQEEIAVLVADVEFGDGQITEMLKVVKQINPQILAIVVTQASDSELVIELINQAQIFRFLNKPVNVKLLRGHLHAALARYLSFVQTPVLVHAQKVEVAAMAEEVRAATFGKKWFDGLKSLRARWMR